MTNAGGARVAVHQQAKGGTDAVRGVGEPVDRRCPGQLVQVCVGVGVQSQGAAERVEYLGRGVAFAPLFQAGVVIRVHPGQDRNLFTAQSGDPAHAVARHADVLRP